MLSILKKIPSRSKWIHYAFGLFIVAATVGCSSKPSGRAIESNPSSTSVNSSQSQSSTSNSDNSSTTSSTDTSSLSSEVSQSSSQASSAVVIPDPDPNAQGGLAFAEQKFLGNVINYGIPDSFGEYWNQVTPENASKWGEVEKDRDQMDWTFLDQAYGYAKANGMPFKLHTLVWGSQEPNWIQDLPPAEQRAEVEEWIQALAARYPDAEMIDVVNEPLHQLPSYRNAIGGSGTSGWDWVIWSFEQARQYFPNAELHLNDYGIVNDPTALEQYKQIALILRARGLIDAIGVQSHAFGLNYLSAADLKSNLDNLASTQLPIYVSEFDIDDIQDVEGFEDVDQGAKYAELFPVFWEHPSVAGVTLWGYIEGQTWRNEENSGILRENGEEKPAMLWLRNYFQARIEQ